MQSTISLKEIERLEALMLWENKARSLGFQIIAGVDEVGRGPLAGPVVAAACALPEGALIEGINDSKKLQPSDRQEIYKQIISVKGVDFGIGIIDVQVIDNINILQATLQAMLLAISHLAIKPDYLLVDGNKMPKTDIPGKPLIKGDTLSQSIAAASIIAKETRDQLMCAYHDQWPEYGFDTHKGYGTKQHLLAIRKNGPCPIHRMSFEPFKSLLT